MPAHPASDTRDRIQALVTVCVLAVVSLVIAFLGAAPARVSATELMGDERAPAERAFVVSHRGGGALAPENTIPAVTAAIDAGFDYLEVDIALTADRVPVLMHDKSVDRTTDGHGRIADLTLAEVQQLDAGSWFAAEYAGTPVPTFEEFLTVLAPSGRRAMLELKGEWDAAAGAALIETLRRHDLERRVAIVSFDPRALLTTSGASELAFRLLILRRLPRDIEQAVKGADARGIIVDWKAVARRPEVVAEMHELGLRVVVYTLNSDGEWKDTIAAGVDGIVTDEPGRLLEWQDAIASGDE
ncbi:glycerophosphodiester phosphodiesterase family protein [Microbacterium sp. SS28]|uniref:glycerophosphodiester phosphodiesterase n=1 Tax=Microbacterium sp. SS28 TaxID=2919948 RepID=UPI001FAB1A39|nr:glycerophosphodiester phosphodiesterase family protein [Microbacterium sp. SS28]